MSKRKGLIFSTAFLDMLFITMLTFAVLYVVNFLLVSPNKKKSNIEMKAEFIITVTWPTNLTHDVDTYVQDPTGEIVFFRKRESNFMHLDRDDQGTKGDSFVSSDGTKITYPYNREMVTLRSSVPGEHSVTVHLYSNERYEGDTRYYPNADDDEDTDLEEEIENSLFGPRTPLLPRIPGVDLDELERRRDSERRVKIMPKIFFNSFIDAQNNQGVTLSPNIPEVDKRSDGSVEVTVRLEKLNPYSVITEKKVTLHERGDEKTAFRFTVGNDGKVIDVNQLEKKIATASAEEKDTEKRRLELLHKKRMEMEERRRQERTRQESRRRDAA
jgi:hypothetical protein